MTAVLHRSGVTGCNFSNRHAACQPVDLVLVRVKFRVKFVWVTLDFV